MFRMRMPSAEDFDGLPTRTWEASLFERLTHDVRGFSNARRIDGSRPVDVAPLDQRPNVFEQPRGAFEAPPPWDVHAAPPPPLPAVSRARRERPERAKATGGGWITALVLVATLAGAGTTLLALDPSARALAMDGVRTILVR
jgi:hypothetical protein